MCAERISDTGGDVDEVDGVSIKPSGKTGTRGVVVEWEFLHGSI